MAHRKTTLCHATHSGTNPFVEITVSDSALRAHSRHQDGEDVIPASGTCDGVASGARVRSDVERPHGKVTICHATGSATNPFVSITISLSALAAHLRHQHEEDRVGAGDCEATPATAPVEAGVLGAVAGSQPAESGDDRAQANVLGAVAGSRPAGSSGGVRPASAEGTQPGGRTGDDEAVVRLPFTGWNVVVSLLIGLALLAAGLLQHRELLRR